MTKLNFRVFFLSKFRTFLVRVFLWSERAVRKAGGHYDVCEDTMLSAPIDSFIRIENAIVKGGVLNYIAFIRVPEVWKLFIPEIGDKTEMLNVVVTWAADELKKRGMIKPEWDEIK